MNVLTLKNGHPILEILFLLKQQKKNKLSTRFNPNIYTVKNVKGTMVTATSEIRSITRNVSFLKHFNAKQYKNIIDLVMMRTITR